MEIVILLFVALGGLAAFLAGAVLLVVYLRSDRGGDTYDDEPVMYGSSVQCAHCGTLNPVDAAVCLSCRQPLPRPAGYGAPSGAPGYAPAPYPAPAPPPAASPLPALGPASLERTVLAQQPPPEPVPRPAPVASRPEGMPHAWFEGARGAFRGQTAVLTRMDTLVGRSSMCDVQINDPKVSRRHFQVRYANGAFFVQDQGSTRGTRINGEPVKAQRLRNGDHIDFGDSGLIFRVEA